MICISSLCLVSSLLLHQGGFWLHVEDKGSILNLAWSTEVILFDFESDFHPERLCFRWTQLLSISLTSETWNEPFPVSKIIVTLLQAVFNPVHGELNFLSLNCSCIFQCTQFCSVDRLHTLENLPCAFVLLHGKLKEKMLNFQLDFSTTTDKVHGYYTTLQQE